MRDFTFTFNGVDFNEKYGIILEKTRDTLTPTLRARTVTVPNRHGVYDYGAKSYAERMVELQCISLRSLSRDEMRDLAYDLSGKHEIVTYAEEEKYYIGQLYDTGIIEYIGTYGNRFVLPFSCEPFAYGEQITEVFENYSPLQYPGTAETPTRITITNNSGYDMHGLVITIRKAVN